MAGERAALVTCAAPEYLAEKFDQESCEHSIRVEIGIENGHVHAGRARVGGEFAQDFGEIARLDARAARRIHRRHHRLVEHVDVEMQPERHAGPAERGASPLQHAGGAQFARGKNVDAGEIGVVDVRPGEIRVAPFPLADLHHLRVGNQRPGNPRPFSEQRLAAPGGQRQVHAGGGGQPGIDVVIAGMAEIAVAVDMHQRQRAGAPPPGQRAKQDGAVAADDKRKLAAPGGIRDDVGEFEIEAP